MAEKILVADDSLTIQKVIAITLANTGYELVECLTHKDLIRELETENYDLVLLDFNLSDSKTGYDLGKEIKNIASDVSILAMLGTFDSVDETELANSGIGEKIVKPFESEKFISKCRALLEGSAESVEVDIDSTENHVVEESIESEDLESDEIGSDWIVDSPRPEDESSSTLEQEDQQPATAEFTDDIAKDALSEEMNSWGIEVPSVIGDDTEFGVFPPKIEASSEEEVSSLDEIELEEIEEDLDDTDPAFELPEDFNSDEVLEASVEEDIDADDFWAVDSDSLDESDSTEDIEEQVEQVEQDEQRDIQFDSATDLNELEDIAEEEVDQIFTDLENEIDSEKESYHVEELVEEPLTSTPAQAVEFDSEELVAEVKEAITPVLEELVKKFCKDKIEQVAWEVIPDLAENLIKKEIKDIANSIDN